VNDDVSKGRRRSIRLSGYDYAQAGAYFVTIVARHRVSLFGEVANGEMRPNQFGRVVQSTWGELANHYSGVECDAFMLMPNHVHGIIVLADEGDVRESDVGAGLKSARGMAAGPNTVRAGLNPPLHWRKLFAVLKRFRRARLTNCAKHPVCRFGNAIITNMSFAMKTNCTASANTSQTIRCNGRWIGRIRCGPQIDQDKKPNCGRFDGGSIGGRV
jgi:hypothetical protein